MLSVLGKLKTKQKQKPPVLNLFQATNLTLFLVNWLEDKH